MRRLPFLLHSQQQQLQVTISSLFSSSAIIINNSNNRKSTVPSFAVPLDFFASLVLPSELSLLHHHVHGFSLMPHLPSCQFRSLHTRWPSTHDFWHSHDPLSLSFIDSWLPTDIPHALCLRSARLVRLGQTPQKRRNPVVLSVSIYPIYAYCASYAY